MINLNEIPRSYEEAVNLLAAWHESEQGEAVRVLSLPDPNGQTVRFVEVSSDFGDGDQPRPIAMGASKDFPYRSEVILVSEGDWSRLKSGLPDGWDLDQLKPVHSVA